MDQTFTIRVHASFKTFSDSSKKTVTSGPNGFVRDINLPERSTLGSIKSAVLRTLTHDDKFVETIGNSKILWKPWSDLGLDFLGKHTTIRVADQAEDSNGDPIYAEICIKILSHGPVHPAMARVLENQGLGITEKEDRQGQVAMARGLRKYKPAAHKEILSIEQQILLRQKRLAELELAQRS